MSNPILSSNQSSAVVATINESTTSNPWVYNETNRLVVPHAMQILTVKHSSGLAQAKGTLTFDIPKNGVAQQMWLRFGAPTFAKIVDTATSKHYAHPLGYLRCIDEIKVTASGRIIEHLDRQQIAARYSDMPMHQRLAAQQSLRMGLKPAETDFLGAAPSKRGDIVMPLPFWFSHDQQRYGLLTNFEEPFRVEVVFSDMLALHYVVNNTASTVESMALTTCDLLVHYRQLDEPQMNEVVSKNYGDGLLSRVVNISKREAPHHFAPATATTVHRATLKLRENEAVRAMYIAVKKTGEPGTTHGNDGYVQYERYCELKNVQLRFNNTTVIDVPGDVLKYYGRWGGSSHAGTGATAVEPEGKSLYEGDGGRLTYIYKIDFGLATGRGLSNVVAFRELSNPELTVDIVDSAAADGGSAAPFEVHVMYDTATFLSTSSSTGRVQLSISS